SSISRRYDYQFLVRRRARRIVQALGLIDGRGPAPTSRRRGARTHRRAAVHRPPPPLAPSRASFRVASMASRDSALIEITPEVLLKAYACGIFPMAESAEDPALYWIEPERRGIIPFESFHVPARLARTVRSDRFVVACNRAFDAVMDGCAEPQAGRQRT